MPKMRADIIASGLVQGVGFRYFVFRNAVSLNLYGFVKNLYSGEVLTVVEGEKHLIEELFKKIKIGPSHAAVSRCMIEWNNNKNEFTDFEIK